MEVTVSFALIASRLLKEKKGVNKRFDNFSFAEIP